MSFSKEQLNKTVAYIAHNVFEKNQSISSRTQRWFEKQLSNLLHSYVKNLQKQRETQFFVQKDMPFMQDFLFLLNHKGIAFPAHLKIAVYSDGRVNDFSLKGAPLAVCEATLQRRSESAATLSHVLKNLSISTFPSTDDTEKQTEEPAEESHEDSGEYDDHDSQSKSAPNTDADDTDSRDGYELDSDSTPDDSDYSSSDNELPNHFDSLAMTAEVHPPFVSAYNLAKDRGKAKQETQMSYKNPKYNPNSKHYKFR